MDDKIGAKLPGAHVSLAGEEVSTWSSYGILGNGQEPPSRNNHLPQHQLYGDNAHSHSHSSHPTGPSIVATAIMESKSLRHFGIGMFATVLFFMFGLAKLGRRRRKHRETVRRLEQDIGGAGLHLATEDDVVAMLRVGQHHRTPQDFREDPSEFNGSSLADDSLPGTYA